MLELSKCSREPSSRAIRNSTSSKRWELVSNLRVYTSDGFRDAKLRARGRVQFPGWNLGHALL